MADKVPSLTELCHGGGSQLRKTIIIKHHIDWDYQPNRRVSSGVTPGRLIIPDEDLCP